MGVAPPWVRTAVCEQAQHFRSLTHASDIRLQKDKLRPSPSLRKYNGETGTEGRQKYLARRALNDQKVNHISQLIHPAFHTALAAAKDRVRDNSAEGAEWASRWTSDYLNQAIFENRWTQIHRDSAGAQYCADFLSILGDFEGGDLRFPDLDLNFEWLPNACCMFDGRTFSHEVLEWTGVKRICLVNYIWESSMNDLGVELPSRAPRLSEIEQRLRAERGTFFF
jgi:hypothetical protein